MQLQTLLQARVFRRSFLLAPLRMVFGNKTALKRVRTLQARQFSIQAGPVPITRTSSIVSTGRARKATSTRKKSYSHLQSGKPVKFTGYKRRFRPTTNPDIPSTFAPVHPPPAPKPIIRVPSFTPDNVAEVVDKFFADLPAGHDRGFGADAFIAEVHRLADEHYLYTKFIPRMWADQRAFEAVHDKRNIALNRAHWKAHDNAIKFRRQRAEHPLQTVTEEVEDVPTPSTSASPVASSSTAMAPPPVPSSLKYEPSLFESTDSAERSSFSKKLPAVSADQRPRSAMRTTLSGAPFPKAKLGREFTDLINEAHRKAAQYTEEIAVEKAAAEAKRQEKERALAAKLKADESMRRHKERKLMEEERKLRQRSMEEKRKVWDAKEKEKIRHQEQMKKEREDREKLYRRQEAERLRREEQEREQIRRTREMHERARTDNIAKFELHDALWKALKDGVEPNGSPIPPIWGHQLPWPVLDVDVTHPSQITMERVQTYVFHAQRPGLQSMSLKNRIRAELLRWHPDKFIPIVMKFVVDNEDERNGILAAADSVTKILNMLKELPSV